METFSFIVAIVLLFLPFIDWTATYILNRGAQRIHSIALSERAKMAAVLAVATTINAVIGANRLFNLHIDPVFILVALSISLIFVSIPNLYWLSIYVRSKRNKID